MFWGRSNSEFIHYTFLKFIIAHGRYILNINYLLAEELLFDKSKLFFNALIESIDNKKLDKIQLHYT